MRQHDTTPSTSDASLPFSFNSASTCNQKSKVPGPTAALLLAKVPEAMVLQRFPDHTMSFGGARVLKEGCAGTSRRGPPLQSMKIRSHSESHLVELDDGSKWQIFPGDLDVTLNWKPDTDLKLVRIDDPVSSHALVSGDENSGVRVLPVGEKWPVDQVRTVLKDNQCTLIASRVLIF